MILAILQFHLKKVHLQTARIPLKNYLSVPHTPKGFLAKEMTLSSQNLYAGPQRGESNKMTGRKGAKRDKTQGQKGEIEGVEARYSGGRYDREEIRGQI